MDLQEVSRSELEAIDGGLTLASVGHFATVSARPVSPGGPVELNPQPLPPGGFVSLNPQPLPPRVALSAFRFAFWQFA
jgi:hypothetical protein